MLLEQRCRGLRPDAARARDLVGRVAAEGDEVRHLLGLDVVALAHLGGPDPRELAHPAHGLQDRDVVGDELERVAVGGRHERGAAGGSLRGDGGGEEVVGLEAGALAAGDPCRLEQAGARSSCSSSSGSNTRPAW